MNILDRLSEHARERTEQAKRKRPFESLQAEALALPRGDFAFERALKKEGLAFICECKKASPSKGLIAEHFPYLEIARDFETAGADAVSVLTEPKWFLGSDDYLREIAAALSIPCLRKDFTVDPYMICEARLLGASAVLLICAILNKEQLRDFLGCCDALGLSALVEAHDENEIETALSVGARLIGVNNRNLKDFSVDTDRSRRLRTLIPPEVLFVSESGVRSGQDVAALREIGADAVLVGEALTGYDQNQALRPDAAGGYRDGKPPDAGLYRLCVCRKKPAPGNAGAGGGAEKPALARHPGRRRVRQ